MALRPSLNGLGASSRSPRVIDRDLEPLASRYSTCAFSCHHGPHLAAEFGRYLPVDERLLNRGRKLTLPANLCRTSVAAHSFHVGRLDSQDGLAMSLRRWRIQAGLKSCPFLGGRFPVAGCGCVTDSLEPLRCATLAERTPVIH